MIFIVNNDPFGAIQLQNQLKNANNHSVEIYLSIDETEQSLYKLPEVVLIDENMDLANLLYLTQSIKAYDSSIQVVWLSKNNSPELKRMCKSYGVLQCLSKEEFFFERLSLTIIEAKESATKNKFRKKRLEKLEDTFLNVPTNNSAL